MPRKLRNVDDREIAKFESVAAKWWSPDGPYGSLHDINPIRLQFISAHAELAGKQVLDIGCGGGILSESMAARGGRVTGIDMARNCLAAARLHSRRSGLTVTYRQATAEAFAAGSGRQFDVVTCMELLEHVPQPTSVVHACRQLLRPGGRLFFATLNRNFKSFLFAIVGAEYVLRLLPAGTHRHAKFIRPAELLHWAAAEGLSLLQASGMRYNPFTRRYALCTDLSVNYLMCFHAPDVCTLPRDRRRAHRCRTGRTGLSER